MHRIFMKPTIEQAMSDKTASHSDQFDSASPDNSSPDNSRSDNMPTSDRSRHRIRLAGPWAVFPEGDDSALVRVMLPIAWNDIPIQNAHRLVFRRTFHAPSGLDSHSVVGLELPVVPTAVRLDGKPLLHDEHQKLFDITSLQTNVHTLEVDIESEPGLSEPVWLIIDESTPSGD